MVEGGESSLLYFATPELSCCDRRGHDLHRRWLVRCFLFPNYEFLLVRYHNIMVFTCNL